ncbi:cytoplasmic protein [Rhodocollybia butyracea]|uniref:Cytoplasmic protein n=1 Tax=Rhodocollybia butyracea TaxID=206335 RepID=A0A9P5Q0N8_9AGAR|nr:cytoplasmic protein [Rhodocollybia butyracea]
MSSSRALNAILPQIEKSPYEAHQKARTFASRYVKSSQYDVAIDVLFQSSRELFKTGQPGSGVDLAGFLLEVYETKGESVTEESRGRLTQLIALAGSEGAWRKTLIDKSLAWSAKHGSCPAGDQALHHYVGELLYKEGSFETAEPHFLASGSRDSARLLAEMFIQWATPSGNFGPFALRGILPYLQNGNILGARTFIKHFVSARGLPRSSATSSPIPIGNLSDEIIVAQDSVVNFAQLAVATCQRAQGERNKVMRESWVRLCGTYQSKGGIVAQPEVRKALQDIATLYFAIPPPRNQASNPLGDMMSSLFGGPAAAPPARRVLTPATPVTGLD